MLPALDKKLVLPIVLFLVIGVVIGYLIGMQIAPKPQAVVNSTKQPEKVVYKSNPIFDHQTATITGKITKVEGDKITVMDSGNNSETFTLVKGAAIANVAGSKHVASSSSIKNIPLNTNAYISLELIEGEYKVNSIFYGNYPASTPLPKKSSIK